MPGRIPPRESRYQGDLKRSAFEKLRLGFLDSIAGTFSFNRQNDGYIQQGQRLSDSIATDDSQVNHRTLDEIVKVLLVQVDVDR